MYKYINGDSGRFHVGYKAQQIKEALETNGLFTKDFAGYLEYNVDPLSDEYHGYTTECGLIYSEFTVLNTHTTQKLMKRIEALELEIKTLKQRKE